MMMKMVGERPRRKKLNRTNLSTRGIPSRFHEITIRDFKTNGDKSLKEVKYFINDYLLNLQDNYQAGRGLFLLGSNGVGKSMLASLVIKEAYAYYYSSSRVTFLQYIDEYTRVWKIKNEEEREEAESLLYHNYKGVDFLCLEELGKEVDSKVSLPILEDLLRYREEKGLPTIICTNLDRDNLQERYGNSVMSLIKGNMTPIQIVTSDKRLRVYEMEGEELARK